MNLRVVCVEALFCVSILAGATRIAILSDIHVTPGNECESKLKTAVAEINSLSDVDIVVVNGDLTNEGSDEQLTNVKGILDHLTKPSYFLPGNHENNWSQSATKTFIDLWGDDRFVTETDSLIIVGINCGPYMKMGDGHIKQEDLHWLSSTLSQRAVDGKKVVSFNHYPLSNDLDNYADYASILECYPTVIHVNGHYHKNEPYNCGGIECMMVRSLDRKNGDFGYTIMDVTPDSVVFYQKRLGLPAERIHGVAARTEAPIDKIRDSIAKEASHSSIPSGWTIEKVWTDSASIFTRLGFDSDNIYFGNSLGLAKSVSKNSGNCRWEILTDASLFSRLSVSNGRVAIPTADKRLIVADSSDGNKLSEYKSEGPYVADGIVENGMLYQGGYKKMEKWDLTSGELVWSFDSIGNYCQASPITVGDNLIFGAWDTHLYCLDKNHGTLRWKWDNGKPANMLGPGNVVPVCNGDRIIIVAPDRYMTAIELSSGKTLWRDNSHKYRESLGICEDGLTAYAKTMDGELVAVDLTAPIFIEKWIVDMGIGYDHAPCIVAETDGVIYAGSRRGILTAISASDHSILFSYPIGVSEINGIDIDPFTGDVWVSLIEGTIWHIKRQTNT